MTMIAFCQIDKQKCSKAKKKKKREKQIISLNETLTCIQLELNTFKQSCFWIETGSSAYLSIFQPLAVNELIRPWLSLPI